MNLIAALAETVRPGDAADHRFFGNVSGVVTDVGTGDNLGRVKARVRGMADNVETGWLSPLWPGGVEGIPHKKDPVLVLFEDGDENRGYYLWFPSSKTSDRPSEAMVLGFAFAAMYNDLAAKLNQLITHFFAHGHPETGVNTGAPAMAATGVALVPSSIGAAGKIQKADGSTVAAAGTVIAAGADTKALSGRVKVGI